MLLQRLREYSERLADPLPTLYSQVPIRYVIELDPKGRLLSPRPTDTSDPANRATKRGRRRPAPQVQRAYAIRPLLLADTAEYTFGLVRSDRERAQKRHAAYLDVLDRCAAATEEPTVMAVRAFLTDNPVKKLELPADFDAGATVEFSVGERFPIDLPSVQAFWASANAPEAGQDEGHRMECIVCGRKRFVLPRLQTKIKGIPGGQTSGTALISANAEAFESYGLSASLVAPTCADCGELLTRGLNALLSEEATHIVVGGAVFVFWTRGDNPFSLKDLLRDPRPEDVKVLIGSVRSGGALPQIDETAFYATVLSASGGRAVVRDWIDTTVGEVRRHLADWFRFQRIVDPYGAEADPMGMVAIAAGTVREAKDIGPLVLRALVRTALTGAPLPSDLLYQAVRRNRAEQGIDRRRAALIKLAISASDQTRREDWMVKLEMDDTDPAYLCGRLLAELEAVQRLALPGVNATIVDRFFGTASSAPASVFGRLIRGAQPHLARLERDRPAAHHALQHRIEDILAGLPPSGAGNGHGFPRILTLEQQGVFALGYYHQRAFDRAQAAAHRTKGSADDKKEAEGD